MMSLDKQLSAVNLLKLLLLITAALISSCWELNNPLDPHNNQVAAPEISPAGGIYNNQQIISISCSTQDAIIRYTTNGPEPSSDSALYIEPFALSENATIKAKAYKQGWSSSKISTATYEYHVSSPEFSIQGGFYNMYQEVEINCITEGSTIRYTTDGSQPCENSPAYVKPIALTNSMVIKVMAHKSGWYSSDVATESYIVVSEEGMISVAGGTFHNGAASITLSSFFIDRHEITQESYLKVMGNNPSLFSGSLNHPVERVSWFNAIEYCNIRSMQEGFAPCYSYSSYGTNPATWPSEWNTQSDNDTHISCDWTANGYRLPTEMEWEFAARGGGLSYGYQYSGSNNIDDVGIYEDNSNNHTWVVGSLAANELGIFDMSGNVQEWCWDRYGSYPSYDLTDPHGSNIGEMRILRGGNFSNPSNFCTISFRISFFATGANYALGFRVVRNSH